VRRALPLVGLLLAPLVPWSQRQIDVRLGVHRAQEEVLYLWSGQHVRRLFPGFESLAADVYWLRTVQYFGSSKLFSSRRDFALLRPLIDITTTLDPRLEIAYRYGAIFLSEPPPGGAGRPQEGVKVLERGALNLPRSWRLRQDLGFFRYLFLHDARGAAETLLEAARIPGSAFWLRTMAADLLGKGGDRPSARRMWQQMYDEAEPGIIKENARIRLSILDSLDTADALAARVKAFESRGGRLAARLDELRSAGLWRGPLTDAAGVAFRYDGTSGKVSISPQSPMWRPE
jgi:hypothetical protein